MDVAELESPVRPGRLPLALAVLGVGVALALGLAAGNPTPATLVPAVLVTGTAVMVTALARPFGAFLVLAASTILLMYFPGFLSKSFLQFLQQSLISRSPCVKTYGFMAGSAPIFSSDTGQVASV